VEEATKTAMKVQTKRFGAWWIISIVALFGVGWWAPQQASVLNYKLAQVTVGLLLAYWADRALFRNAPDIDTGMPRDVVSAARLIARAILAFGIIHGLAVGI
jgi:hypothetical protein